MFHWVLIEIELDLFVDYKTSFAFVLATDAVKSIRITETSINVFFSNFRFNVFCWVLIEMELDLCGHRMIYTNTHKCLLTKTIY